MYSVVLRSLCLCLLLGLTGCKDDRGCFGLCSKKDDDDTSSPPTTVLDRSCYPDSQLGIVQRFTYAETDPTAQQVMTFRAIDIADSSQLQPTLIWVTGDTWRIDNDPEDVPQLAIDVAEELGAHLAVVGYRDLAVEWPVPVQDVNTAIRYLKTQASTLNIDANRFVLAGDQAGAHLASLAGTSSGIQEFVGEDHLSETSRVQALILFSGIYDFQTIVNDAEAVATSCGVAPTIAIEPVKRLFDCDDATLGSDPLSECDANIIEQASPLFHASSDDPTVLLWHGLEDCDVPSAQSDRLSNALDGGSVNSVLTLVMDDDEQLDSLTADEVERELASVVTCES